MLFIKLIYASFCRSLIRFFDNIFVRNNDVEYYRMEMEKLRQENKEYRDILITRTQPLTDNVQRESEQVDWQPAKESYKPWHVKQRELEYESRERAARLEREAKVALASTKSTEELEAELLSGED